MAVEWRNLTVGQRLKLLRLAQVPTPSVREVARATCLDRSTITEAERTGGTPARRDHLCRCYGITREQLESDLPPVALASALRLVDEDAFQETTDGDHDR